MSEWSPVMLLGVNESLIGECSGQAPGYHVSCREDKQLLSLAPEQ